MFQRAFRQGARRATAFNMNRNFPQQSFHLPAYTQQPMHNLPKLDINAKIVSCMSPELRELLLSLEELDDEASPVSKQASVSQGV